MPVRFSAVCSSADNESFRVASSWWSENASVVKLSWFDFRRKILDSYGDSKLYYLTTDVGTIVEIFVD